MQKENNFSYRFFCFSLMLTFLVCLFAAPETGFGEIKRLKERQDAQWLCDLFMLKLTELDANEAFLTLRPYSGMAEDDFSVYAEQANAIIETVKPDYGEVIGFVLVDESNIKDIVLRYTYLLKYERHALRWTFYFYRAEREWFFNEFNVDNKLHELFN
jgi:hypothetical protein